MRLTSPNAFVLSLGFLYASVGLSQGVPLSTDLKWLSDTAAVSGYERTLSLAIEKRLAPFHPRRDAMGDVTVTFGTGAPHRLLVAPIDEPGYVVSHIDDDGYLRVMRLPQTGLPPHYNEMQNAQPMLIATRDGSTRTAIVAGLSIHLTPGRANVPDPDDLDTLYVDLGAHTKAEVLTSGIDLLSPIAAERSLSQMGRYERAGTAVADRFGAAILLQIVEALSHTAPTGTTTVAFAAQQWTGSRGLIRLLQEIHPDEVVYLGRANKPLRSASSPDPSPISPALGSGVLLNGVGEMHSPVWLTSNEGLKKNQAAPFLLRGYGPASVLPEHSAHLSVPVLYPLTAGETVDLRDLDSLLQLVADHLNLPKTREIFEVPAPTPYAPSAPRPASIPSTAATLKILTEVYGVSEQEAMSREAVERMLPPWAHPTTDDAGNLVLHLGTSAGTSRETPTGRGMVFMAHTDELGFRVRSIDADGTLQLDNKGGGTTSFFWGHPAVVHTSKGMRSAVVGLPANFETATFHFPTDFRSPATLNVGAQSAAEVVQLGIKVGDSVTISKHLRTLLSHRVSVRGLDDRVGCAAMVHAVWELGEKFSRDVTFVWSTREELGLLGAVAYADAAEKAGRTPDTVFAIDTFVSSDSPLESKRFADGVLGDGFLVRAIDNSNIVPWADVQRVQQIAKAHNIPMQYGVTGGGNDGAAFQRYGTTDVALSWPLRNSHSPGEVMDLADLNALSSIVSALAREWKK